MKGRVVRSVTVRISAVREVDPEEVLERNGGPCAGCAYLGEADRMCRAGQARAQVLGLPSCQDGFVYVEEVV